MWFDTFAVGERERDRAREAIDRFYKKEREIEREREIRFNIKFESSSLFSVPEVSQFSLQV